MKTIGNHKIVIRTCGLDPEMAVFYPYADDQAVKNYLRNLNRLTKPQNGADGRGDDLGEGFDVRMIPGVAPV